MPAPRENTTVSKVFFVLVAVAFSISVSAQSPQHDCTGTAFPTLTQKKVYNVTIPGTNNVHGYIEHLPNDYHTTNKQYPLLIWFHGINETGPGSETSLCRFFPNQWWLVPPILVERQSFPVSVKDQHGEDFKFILISPQLEGFTDPTNTINALINYLTAQYRVDRGRVYLTGISAGGNYILSYAGASEANARNITAIVPVAHCDVLNTTQATNISRAGLRVWAVKCGLDNTCGSSQAAQMVATTINSINPNANLAHHTTLPVPNYDCNIPDPHDAWSTAYDVNFRQNVNGRNVNVYEWMVQFDRTAAGNTPTPVKLEDYTVRLHNGKVYVRWTTSMESNNKHFSIERGAQGEDLVAITTVPAAGDGNGNGATYEWVDERPLANISYYRLVQTDKDGKTTWFPIKKVLNRKQWVEHAMVSPNPFVESIGIFINVDKAQPVNLSIADMNGKMVRRVSGMYNEGTSEVRIDARDLPRGIYVLKIEGVSFSETKKIVKQ
jgi:predicted esterase